MYKSKIKISTESKGVLLQKMQLFLVSNKNIYCKSLKRNINLSKLPTVITNRKNSATSRLRTFFVVIDVLKKEREYTKRVSNKRNEYEIVWLDNNWIKVYIHLREEINNHKDKVLYFVSCY